MPEMTEKVSVKRGKRAAFLVKRTKSPYLNVSFLDFAVLRTRANLKSAEKGGFLRKKSVKTPCFWLRQGTLTIGKGLFCVFFLEKRTSKPFFAPFYGKKHPFLIFALNVSRETLKNQKNSSECFT